MSNSGLIPGVEPISDNQRPAYRYDLIEIYESDGYALSALAAWRPFKRINGTFYEVTNTDRISLDWQTDIFAPILAEQVPSFFFGRKRNPTPLAAASSSCRRADELRSARTN